ncbi:MAG: selenocysteine-specific translation elongation factor [Desulfuromonas sp.]|nr:MAG: selenocysteine-specific translation elongation factor [Desulfuromonas sp.]
MSEFREQIIIGTAGHVDHGKTALIRALTGIETDRLGEEKERGISIKLGFAPLKLPDGQIAGVIDVPGHEKFIPQMLAGVASIDLVLMVVDANEGIMPQSREHLQIMQLLEIKRGILVLNKCDLVEPDWLDIVEEEVREQVEGTFLEGAPCCRVSAITGEGIPDLLQTITAQMEKLNARDASGPVRLPVDRCFSISGFGTVTTGTLLSGTVRVGDNLELLPKMLPVRVRDVQVHGESVAAAFAGQRVALNLSGISKDQIPSGSVIGTSGLFRATQRIDVRLKLLKNAPKPLKFRDPVHFYLGTARAVGEVAMLDRDEMQQGDEVLAQIHLDRPLMAHRQDLFIIRSYSPMTTIGGGRVIDSEPAKHKRFRKEVLQRLEELESGEQGFWLQKLDDLTCARLRDMERHTGSSREQLRAGLERMVEDGWAVQLADQFAVVEKVRSWKQQLPELVAAYHADNPLLHGIPRATLKGKLPDALATKGFELILQETVDVGQLVVRGDLVATPDWTPVPDEKQQRLLDRVEGIFKSGGMQVKNRNETLERLDLEGADPDPLFLWLTVEKRLIRLNPESYIHRDCYEVALKKLIAYFKQNERLTLAEFRDLIGSNRKLTQGLLEHFDGCKYTRRAGDERVAWDLPESV